MVDSALFYTYGSQKTQVCCLRQGFGRLPRHPATKGGMRGNFDPMKVPSCGGAGNRLELTGGCHAVPPKARDGSQRHVIFIKEKITTSPERCLLADIAPERVRFFGTTRVRPGLKQGPPEAAQRFLPWTGTMSLPTVVQNDIGGG